MTPELVTDAALSKSERIWLQCFAVRTLIDLIVDLLWLPGAHHEEHSVSRKSVAGKMPLPYPRFLERLKRGFSDEEHQLLVAGVQSLCRDARAEGLVPRFRLDLASLLAADFDRSARLLLALVQQPPQAGEAKLADKSKRHEILSGALAQHRSGDDSSSLDDSRALKMARRVYPDLQPEELGFAFHLLGEADLASTSPANSRAIQLFKKAAEHETHRVFESYRQQLRSIDRVLASGQLSEEAVKELSEESVRILSVCETLSTLISLPLVEFASLARTLASNLKRRFPASPELCQVGFSKALTLYGLCVAQSIADPATPRLIVARLQHNVGYCALELAALERHRGERLRQALIAFADSVDSALQGKRLEYVAYNLKFMAITFHELEDRWNALWCARLAVRVYGTVPGPQEQDVQDARKRLKKLEGDRAYEELLSRVTLEPLPTADLVKPFIREIREEKTRHRK